MPGNTRVVNTTRVIPRQRIVDENTLVVHVKPVIRKDVVVHRQNILYKDIIVHRQNTVHRTAERYSNVVINRTERGSVGYAGADPPRALQLRRHHPRICRLSRRLQRLPHRLFGPRLTPPAPAG